MNSDSIKELNYFVNKPITVITKSINRNFNETQNIDYFTGICEKVTTDGVITKHTITGCKNFFIFSSIVGIFEEQQLDPKNPEHALLINEMKEKSNIKSENVSLKNVSLKNSNNELNIDSLNKLIQE